jgi:DNA-damage-inducible protein J
MTLDSTVRARVDSNLKNEVEKIFNELGLSTSQAITLFLKKVKMERGIPFELKIPNETTLKAMEEAKNMDGKISSLEEFAK